MLYGLTTLSILELYTLGWKVTVIIKYEKGKKNCNFSWEICNKVKYSLHLRELYTLGWKVKIIIKYEKGRKNCTFSWEICNKV